jgi:enterochelin esterase family protein
MISESQGNPWSLVVVPGTEFADVKDVPRGAVAEGTYRSTSLGRFRRMHVYTPPGYESGTGIYPTFYLLHGASDSDNSWSSVGRAGFILDNLIAEGKAKPMVVVMPAGHAPRPEGQAATPDATRDRRQDPFVDDFVQDILPYIEKTYRVHKDRRQRAIAGLSMGGGQTLNILVRMPDAFGSAGVFSSGVFGIAGGRRGGDQAAPQGPSWEEQNKQVLDGAGLKGIELIWFGTGKEDFLLETSRKSVEMLKSHGLPVVYEESGGGHTWLVWRAYLGKFVPLLFKSERVASLQEEGPTQL